MVLALVCIRHCLFCRSRRSAYSGEGYYSFRPLGLADRESPLRLSLSRRLILLGHRILCSFARSALKDCLRCHMRVSVLLMTRSCLCDHTERWSLTTFSGWAQHSLASLLCRAMAVSGQSCRKCHSVSAFGWPKLRQNLHAFRMHTSDGRTGSPALRPCPPQSSLEMVMADTSLMEWWWTIRLMSCPYGWASVLGE